MIAHRNQDMFNKASVITESVFCKPIPQNIALYTVTFQLISFYENLKFNDEDALHSQQNLITWYYIGLKL